MPHIDEIQLGDLALNATSGERALRDADAEIYQYAGKLVRPIIETVTAANGRNTAVARLEPITATYSRSACSSCPVASLQRSGPEVG